MRWQQNMATNWLLSIRAQFDDSTESRGLSCTVVSIFVPIGGLGSLHTNVERQTVTLIILLIILLNRRRDDDLSPRMLLWCFIQTFRPRDSIYRVLRLPVSSWRRMRGA